MGKLTSAITRLWERVLHFWKRYIEVQGKFFGIAFIFGIIWTMRLGYLFLKGDVSRGDEINAGMILITLALVTWLSVINEMANKDLMKLYDEFKDLQAERIKMLDKWLNRKREIIRQKNDEIDYWQGMYVHAKQRVEEKELDSD